MRDAPGYDDPAAVEAQFSRALAAYGFDRWSCTLIDPERYGREPPALARRDFEAWDARYWSERYIVNDPCVALLRKSARPFAWSDAKALETGRDAEAMWSDARADGMSDGFVVRVFGPNGLVVLVRMATGEAGVEQNVRAALESLATVYATLMLGHWEVRDAGPDHGVITQRQAQCLYWASRGKTDWEIATIMGLSWRTVHHHVENAKQRLGVTKRSEAVLKAGELGLLQPA